MVQCLIFYKNWHFGKNRYFGFKNENFVPNCVGKYYFNFLISYRGSDSLSDNMAHSGSSAPVVTLLIFPSVVIEIDAKAHAAPDRSWATFESRITPTSKPVNSSSPFAKIFKNNDQFRNLRSFEFFQIWFLLILLI